VTIRSVAEPSANRCVQAMRAWSHSLPIGFKKRICCQKLILLLWFDSDYGRWHRSLDLEDSDCLWYPDCTLDEPNGTIEYHWYESMTQRRRSRKFT
jgi:hypothetical protein